MGFLRAHREGYLHSGTSWRELPVSGGQADRHDVPDCLFDNIRLKNLDRSQMLHSFRRAIACQAANKNHQGNPCPPGRHCQTGPMSHPDVQSRRGSEEPSRAALAQETVIRLDCCARLQSTRVEQLRTAECGRRVAALEAGDNSAVALPHPARGNRRSTVFARRAPSQELLEQPFACLR